MVYFHWRIWIRIPILIPVLRRNFNFLIHFIGFREKVEKMNRVSKIIGLVKNTTIYINFNFVIIYIKIVYCEILSKAVYNTFASTVTLAFLFEKLDILEFLLV